MGYYVSSGIATLALIFVVLVYKVTTPPTYNIVQLNTGQYALQQCHIGCDLMGYRFDTVEEAEVVYQRFLQAEPQIVSIVK